MIDRLDHYQVLKRKFKVETEGLQKLLDDFKTGTERKLKISKQVLSFIKKELRILRSESIILASKFHEKT